MASTSLLPSLRSEAPKRDMGRTFGNPVKVMPREQTGRFLAAVRPFKQQPNDVRTLYVHRRRLCGLTLSCFAREQGFLLSRKARLVEGELDGWRKIMNLAKNEIMLNNFPTVL